MPTTSCFWNINIRVTFSRFHVNTSSCFLVCLPHITHGNLVLKKHLNEDTQVSLETKMWTLCERSFGNFVEKMLRKIKLLAISLAKTLLFWTDVLLGCNETRNGNLTHLRSRVWETEHHFPTFELSSKKKKLLGANFVLYYANFSTTFKLGTKSLICKSVVRSVLGNSFFSGEK